METMWDIDNTDRALLVAFIKSGLDMTLAPEPLDSDIFLDLTTGVDVAAEAKDCIRRAALIYS